MNDGVKNLLYDHPEYYEVLYPELNDETPEICRRAFDRFLRGPPSSILDLGCGTGRDIRSLRKTCSDCVGVDFLPKMIDFAKTRSNEITFLVGDMRSLRLGRTFDVVLCFGSALINNPRLLGPQVRPSPPLPKRRVQGTLMRPNLPLGIRGGICMIGRYVCRRMRDQGLGG